MARAIGSVGAAVTLDLESGRIKFYAGSGADVALRVLLIEDDQAVVDMYCLRLVADGHTVAVASDGEEGLRMALEEDPDFILLDLRLPKLSGLELLSRLRASPKSREIPVIVLSNVTDIELLHRGGELGVLEYMLKADTTPMQLSMRLAEHTRRTEDLNSYP